MNGNDYQATANGVLCKPQNLSTFTMLANVISLMRNCYHADSTLASAGKVRLILFDALDRLAGDWPGIRLLAKGLLQVALDLRSCRSIRAKLFVRPDMLEDREILAFPDASKLLARKVPLFWRRMDLYALLFQCLENASSGGDEFGVKPLK